MVVFERNIVSFERVRKHLGFSSRANGHKVMRIGKLSQKTVAVFLVNSLDPIIYGEEQQLNKFSVRPIVLCGIGAPVISDKDKPMRF